MRQPTSNRIHQTSFWSFLWRMFRRAMYRNFYSGNFINLSSDKYEKAKALRISFPVELLQEPNTIIGWPDVTDGGGLYIEYENNGVHKFWLIDQAKENVPTKYHSFHDQVNQIISQL